MRACTGFWADNVIKKRDFYHFTLFTVSTTINHESVYWSYDWRLWNCSFLSEFSQNSLTFDFHAHSTS